jgi:hypothetical protein
MGMGDVEQAADSVQLASFSPEFPVLFTYKLGAEINERIQGAEISPTNPPQAIGSL